MPSSSLIFTLLREAQQRTSPDISTGPGPGPGWLTGILRKPGSFCWILPPLLIRVWYPPDTIELDCWYPDNRDLNRPKELLLNRSTPPCPIYHLFPSIFGLWARSGRVGVGVQSIWQPLLIVGFEKSKPTTPSQFGCRVMMTLEGAVSVLQCRLM